jgi:hypothetical protein
MLTRVRTARRHVAAARLALRSSRPEDILQCLPPLDEAIADLRAIEGELVEGELVEGDMGGPAPRTLASTELVAELTDLRQELAIVRRAVEHNLALQLKWARILGASASGYTAAGDAVPLTATATMSVRG